IKNPSIAIEATALNKCVPALYNIAGIILSADSLPLHWKWSINGGSNISGQTLYDQILPVAGNYLIQATATDMNGCKKMVSKTIPVYLQSKIIASADTLICNGSPASLLVSGAVNYYWEP